MRHLNSPPPVYPYPSGKQQQELRDLPRAFTPPGSNFPRYDGDGAMMTHDIDRMDNVKGELQSVTKIMHGNLARVMERGETLGYLDNKTGTHR